MNDIQRPANGLLLLVSGALACCPLSSPIARAQQEAQNPSLPRGNSGGIGKAKLAEKPVEALGGRLTVRMPQGARIEARPFPIMGSPESAEHETRVLFDAGDERLVLMVKEAFAFAGDDFEKDVKEWVANLIYVGGAPDYHPGAKKGVGMLFGKKVEWHSVAQGEGLQTICRLPIPGDEHRSAHIMFGLPASTSSLVWAQPAAPLRSRLATTTPDDAVDRIVAAEMEKQQIPGLSLAVIEKGVGVTGKPFPQFMEEAVLTPAGMKESTFEQPLATERAKLVAAGHYANHTLVKEKWHIYPEMAAAGLWTTPADLVRFAAALQDALAGKSTKMLSKQIAR
jgi:Beta-lactamase